MQTLPQTENLKFDKRVFTMLTKIKNELVIIDWRAMSVSQLALNIAEQIRDISDSLQTPIFRIDERFTIYYGDKPFELGKKAFRSFLVWCLKHIGLPIELIHGKSFPHKLFDCCREILKPEE